MKNIKLSLNLENRFLYILVFVFILLIILLHGAFPFFQAPNLNIQSYFEGPAKCLVDQNRLTLTCDSIGFPLGYRTYYGFPVYFFIILMNKIFALGFVDGIQLFNSISIVLGYLSLVHLVRKLSQSSLISICLAFLYYQSPFLLSSSGFPGLHQGFLLTPFILLVLYKTYFHFLPDKGENKRLRLVVLLILTFFIGIFTIFLDGYTFIMIFVAYFIGILTVSLREFRKDSDNRVIRILTNGSALFAFVCAGFAYKNLIYSNSEDTFSLNFFRGQGIDVLTALVPNKNYLVTFFSSKFSWDPYLFFGDGANANFNYLGIILVSTVLVTIYVCLKKREINTILPILLALGISSMFALGPSLKICDYRFKQEFPNVTCAQMVLIKEDSALARKIQVESKTVITASQYEMTPKEATMNFPWSFLFRIPVISTMRSTYRWQVIVRLSLICIAAIGIAKYSRKEYLAFFLCVILIIEGFPSISIWNPTKFSEARLDRSEVIRDVTQVIHPIISKKHFLILPADNDFLSAYFAPFTESFQYNAFFDKEIKRIRSNQSDQINRAIQLFKTDKLTSSDLVEILCLNEMDLIVLARFNLRWNSYSWPPSVDDIGEADRKILNMKLLDEEKFMITKYPFFYIIQKNINAGCKSP